MKHSWNATVLAVAALLGVANAPAVANAASGDLNNDGNRTIADVLILSQCIANGGTCPAVSPGPLCGSGALIDCGDLFGDNNVSLGALNADLAVLNDSLAGLETLFDLCEGPGSTIACPGGNVTLPSQTITTSQVWPKVCNVTIGGTVLVDTLPGAPTTVLTIEAGSTVKGQSAAVDPPTLIFLPGAKINAQGTSAQPIIFTSDKAPGTRGPSDWGGVMINGRSTVNRPNCFNFAEGLAEPYGGCDPSDSSGIITYARIEFAGRIFTPNNELNNFTMNGVGSGTVVNHIQAKFGADDCIEWFGGTVNSDHLVAAGCGDDGLDWQLGFTGNVQFALQLQNATNYSAGNGESRGIEADNSEFGNDDLPRSNPTLCNLAMVGDKSTAGSDVGIFLRRGTAGAIANAIVTNYLDAGIEMRDNATGTKACVNSSTLNTTAPVLSVRSSIFYNNGDAGSPVPNAEQCKTGTASPQPQTSCTSCQWYALLNATNNVLPTDGTNAVNPNVPLTYPAPATLYEGRPTSTAGFPPAFDCRTVDGFFAQASYVGAFDPSDPNPAGWLDTPGGWINFDIN